MRIGLAVPLLLLQGCLVAVAEGGTDAGRVDAGLLVDAGSRFDAGATTDAGAEPVFVSVSCPRVDAGSPFPWCLDSPGTTRRCADAELVGCATFSQRLLVGEGHLVWFSFDYANRVTHVWARSLDGSAPRELAQSGEAWAIAIGGGHVWWAEVGTGSLFRVPLRGGPAQLMIVGGLRNVRALAANEAFVFIGSADGITRLPFEGGPLTTLVPGVDPSSFVLDATGLFWGEVTSGRIARFDFATVQITTLFPAAGPWLLHHSNGYLYWSVDSSPAPVVRGRITGGPPEILASNQDVPRDLAVDDRGLYWIEQGGNFGPTLRLHRANPDGSGETTFLTVGLGARLALDGPYLYIAGENVYRLRR